MEASGSVFSETLQGITNTKLEELSKRRLAYEAEKTAVLESLPDKIHPAERLHALSTGVKKCFRIAIDSNGKVMKGWTKFSALEVELKNLDRFLAQAQHDPSIPNTTLQKWEDSLLRHLSSQSMRFEYATLYGQLVTEWLSSEKSAQSAFGEDVDMKEDFETVDSAKKLQARMAWEELVFEPANVDLDKLMKYLDTLFGVGNPKRKPLFRVLVRLREEVKDFEAEFRNKVQFTLASLRWTIQGLVRSDLLTDEKRDVLQDFANNDTILGEIADVLNMRMATIGTWSWGSSVPLEQRRKITGAFSIQMHEDLLQAIFLHYIGVKLSIFFKGAFSRFRRAGDAWESNRQSIPPAEWNRLEYYLGPLERSGSLQVLRRREYRKNYFMSQLVQSEDQPVEAMEGDEEADYLQASQAAKHVPSNAMPMQMPTQMSQQPQQQALSQQQDYQMQMMLLEQQNKKRLARAAPQMVPVKRRRFIVESGHETNDDSESDDEDEIQPKRPMAMKKRLLHLLSAEITMNTELHGELTAFHSTFNNWYSSFPHQTIKTIMALFGFSQTWRNFFTAFLEAPLKFLDDDDSTKARIRCRGTPGSHALSEVFGEVTLFVLDFAVNQATSGQFLWRLHDDFWFWSPDHQLCVKAWKAVREFTEATGTYINDAKTGTARITKNNQGSARIDSVLPQGEIRWGFLKLSPEKGRFVIDQDIVDGHIVELRKQLQEKSNSVFNFIQTWNVYVATFFTSNFGKPANCFGRDHVDEMLKTHERIQREIFSASSSLGTAGEKSSNIVDYLKNTIEERFGVTDIPEGYLYFPVELGGLDLQSPFISLLQLRDSLIKSSVPLLTQLRESEREDYEKAKKWFESGSIKQLRRDVTDPHWEPASKSERENFFSFEDYTKYREELKHDHRMPIHDVYERLLEEPTEESIESSGAMISEGIAQLMSQSNLRGILGNWQAMKPYWRWVTMLYGPEVQERFGGLNIVDPGLLPMGMVRVFKEKRVKWQA